MTDKFISNYKKHSLLLFAIVLIFGCSSNREENENCRFLLNLGVNEPINLNLPAYSKLQFSGNSVYYPFGGNGGLLIARVGNDFFAWDAADPNHVLSSCSVLVPTDLTAKCTCDDKNEYSLVNGLPLNNGDLQCTLRNYRAEASGNTLVISN